MDSDDQAQSVLVLDLSVSADQYISDHRTQALAPQLQQLGLSVAVAHGVVADADDRSLLTELVRRRDCDCVVMVHAWDTDLLHAVRKGMKESARLVRLTDGVEAALDREFDFVVDDNELIVLLSGGKPEKGGAWKPTSAGELRRQGPDTRSANPGEIVEWIALHDGDSHNRPTISGPSAGCPFLLDTRANPIYDNVKMDPKQVQTRGCSFCLDNFGAYTVSSEADTVNSWLSQIRTIRSGRPDTREFLLTDERPHPYLPAFFRALANEPDMAPVELLIKSRIDWLLEFADGEIAQAAQLAAAHGHVLHVYLIGFENFEQFHLDLFNKGVSVADNVEAIEKIRQLGRRFPDSLEYRRLRAHGIVLFTPWTEPEHLVVNARVMRDVGFGEFRSDPLDTRLRLYPRVPLHSKAQQEGLLLESFPAGRPDRAGEQGYDASVAWRFADARTEAVFQLCRALTDHPYSNYLDDADLLELAARFVMRWPGLAAAPELAHLAFLAVAGNPANHNLAGKMREMIDIDATERLLFDCELEGIRAGLKRLSLKEGVPPDRAEALTAAYRAMGFAADVASRQGAGLDSGSGALDESGTRVIVAVAADEESLAEAIALNRIIHERGIDRSQAVARLGELLGYPACCVAEFTRIENQADNLQLERTPFMRAPESILDPLNNRLAVEAPLLSHHICRPDCAESARAAATLLDALERSSPSAATWTREHLTQDRLVLGYDAHIALTGRLDDEGRYHVDGASTLGSAARPELWHKARSFTMDADGVELVLDDGSRPRIAAMHPLLVTPGRAIGRAALQAISDPSTIAGSAPRAQKADNFDTDAAVAERSPTATPLSTQQAAGFLATCFGYDTMPISIAGGIAVTAFAPTRSKCGFDVELADGDGNRVKAYVVRSKSGEPAYAASTFMSLAYYGGDEEVSSVGAANLQAMMNALRDALIKGEARLDEAAIDTLFTPEEP